MGVKQGDKNYAGIVFQDGLETMAEVCERCTAERFRTVNLSPTLHLYTRALLLDPLLIDGLFMPLHLCLVVVYTLPVYQQCMTC